MKLSLQKKVGISVALCGVTLCAWLGYPEWRYHRALQKYKLGTALQAIERDSDVRLDPKATRNILPDDAPEEQKRLHSVYMLHVPNDYVYLGFNADHELVEVMKFTPLSALKRIFGL